MSFNNKKIWLVGASEGIGEALAIKLAADGARLVLSARNAEKLTDLQKRIGTHHIVVPMDVIDPASVHAAWQKIHQEYNGVDTVVYNAGTYFPASAVTFNLSQIEKTFDVNLHGALRVLAETVPYFVAQKSGHIVLVASVAGYQGLPNSIGYGASKAALIHLAENLAIDLRASNVKVQVVNPGFVKTRLTEKNAFEMPFLQTPERAAEHIAKGIQSSSFEIHFPKVFSYFLKSLKFLPYPVYFWLMRYL